MPAATPSPSPRISPFDIAVAALFTALGVLLMVENIDDAKISASVWVVPVFLLVTVPLLWRRREPLLVVAVIAGALWLHVALFGSIVRCGAAFPVLFVAAYSGGARLEKRESLMALGLALIGVAAVGADDTQVDIGFAVTAVAAITAAFWGAGRLVRSRSVAVRAEDRRPVTA
jgi:hypothetical protein